MNRLIPRPVLPGLQSLTPLTRRCLSAKAIYSSFPATLMHHSLRQRSSLFDYKGIGSRPDDAVINSVTVEKDGLVHPATDQITSLSNGAVMFPNTFKMQDIVHQIYYDRLMDRGTVVEKASMFTVPKGTPIPRHLILVNEYSCRFSLRPFHAMTLKDLNQALDEFYDKYAVKETDKDWMDKHPIQSAVLDDADEKWMAK